MKRILVVHYSQSGQLRRIAESFCSPLTDHSGIELTWLPLQPEPAYPFPWSFFEFFDQFPECVHQRPPRLAPTPHAADRKFDLVILAYTVWFLSPSPPITAFLTSDVGRTLLRDTSVVTVLACRNMWLSADQQVRELLASARARHLDHVVFTDPGPALATFITTPRWMFTGRQDAFWGMPPAGVPETEIAAASRFGKALASALDASEEQGERPLLTGLRAVRVDERLIASERIGRRSFEIWGRLIMAAGRPGSTARKCVLVVYAGFLITMIVTVVPVTMLLRTLLRPLTRAKMARIKEELEKPSGSGRERMSSLNQSLPL